MILLKAYCELREPPSPLLRLWIERQTQPLLLPFVKNHGAVLHHIGVHLKNFGQHVGLMHGVGTLTHPLGLVEIGSELHVSHDVVAQTDLIAEQRVGNFNHLTSTLTRRQTTKISKSLRVRR